MIRFKQKTYSGCEFLEEICEKEKDLLREYGLDPREDNVLNIWIDSVDEKFSKRGLPSDIELEGGLGNEDNLKFYYSPTKGWFMEGEDINEVTPIQVSDEDLKDQIMKSLKKELNHLENVGSKENIINFQEDNIKLVGNTKCFSHPYKIIWKTIKTYFQALKEIAKRIKHKIQGRQTSEHPQAIHGDESQKSFSDVSLDPTLENYTKTVPGYSNLQSLSIKNLKYLLDMGLTAENIAVIQKLFPSFISLADPKKITLFRNDYINGEKGDYAEILFMYGNEVDFIWDFDKESWYLRDHTFTPSKEYIINDGRLKEAIRNLFNPDSDELLRHRIEKWEAKEDLNEDFNVRSYCEYMLNLIDSDRSGWS